MKTTCHICKSPMEVPVEPDEFFSAEKIASIATCGSCYRRRRGLRTGLPTPPPTTDQGKLPYADH